MTQKKQTLIPQLVLPNLQGSQNTAQLPKQLDIIIVTGEYHDDHPLSPSGVLARVLQARGYNVGIIEKPTTDKDFSRLGRPLLGFCVTSGSVDSMLNNYTPLKRKRESDQHCNITKMPDRAVIYYCNKLRQLHKKCCLIIGGVEASLRRFPHYDYWSNSVRRSILLDSRADILVYGNGEKQLIEIVDRLRDGIELGGVLGTCVISKIIPESFLELPTYEQVLASKNAFCKMQNAFSNEQNLAQKCGPNYLLQYKYPKYSTADLDWIYSLGYTRNLHPNSMLKMALFSVATHRGCFGKCNFCAVALHQGERIVSRSEASIVAEVEKLSTHPKFKGYIDDMGGPSANMYGMDCRPTCQSSCLSCKRLCKDHKRAISLLRQVRKVKGVKKVFIRSGIRYDLAMNNPEYLKEISKHHISGCLKIAPEHFAPRVLALMNKENSSFDQFLALFQTLNRNSFQQLRYYFMVGHPGDSKKETRTLIRKLSTLKNIEQFQLFTPTPMTISTCMYWTGLNPKNFQEIHIIRDYKTKKELKRMLLNVIDPI